MIIGFSDGSSIPGIPTAIGMIGGIDVVTFIDMNTHQKVSRPFAEIADVQLLD